MPRWPTRRPPLQQKAPGAVHSARDGMLKGQRNAAFSTLQSCKASCAIVKNCAHEAYICILVALIYVPMYRSVTHHSERATVSLFTSEREFYREASALHRDGFVSTQQHDGICTQNHLLAVCPHPFNERRCKHILSLAPCGSAW